MTVLVIEDGTVLDGSPKANSFVTEQEYINFFTVRNDVEATDADSETICASLVRAWDYMNQEFRLRFAGSLVAAFQAGSWPRRGVPVPDFFDPWYQNTQVPFEFRHTVFIPENFIPEEVKEAQILLARHSQQSTTTSASLETSFGRVTKREKLGELEVEYFGANGGGERQTTLYWDALKRLQPFLKPTNIGSAIRS